MTRLSLLLGACAPLLVAARPAGPRSAAADTVVVRIPDAEALRKHPLRAHPRLFASADRFAALRRQIGTDPVLGGWYRQVKAKADGYLTDGDVPRYEIPDGLRLLAMSRRVLDRVSTLALVSRIENDPRYAARVWEELEAAAAFPDWNPKHFLDVGEMTTAFAIGYDWLYDRWTPAQRARIRHAIVEHGLRPGLQGYQGNPVRNRWPDAEHNWNQVTNGGMGIGALAILDEEPELAGTVLHEGLKRLPRAMRHYGPDGAWNEGPGYWHYATLFNVLILSALETSLGTDFGLARIPGFAETGWFPIYLSSPAGPSFAFADVGRNAGPTIGAELHWLARRFNQPAFLAHQLQFAPPSAEKDEGRSAAFNVVWYDPAPVRSGAGRNGLPLDRHFRVAEVVTMRSAWNDPNALWVGFKAGDNKANHSNLDLGTFVLDAHGVRWATELGRDNYNLPGYFNRGRLDAPRHTYYRMRAEGQNTLVLNPDRLADQDPLAEARIVRFTSLPDRAAVVADLTAAYARHARSVHRGIALLNNRSQVLVQDEVRAENPTQLWWFMHTEADVQLGPDDTAVLAREGKRLWAKVLAPANAPFQVMDARPLPSTPDPEGQNRNEGIRKLVVRLDAVTDSRVVVLLVPLGAGETVPQALPEVRPLASW